MGNDQVYGNAYVALKVLMERNFGKEVTDLAMNGRTWCCSNFDCQILPAIEEAFEANKENTERKRVNKLVELLRMHGFSGYGYEGVIEIDTNENEEPATIPATNAAVMKFLGY